MCRKMRTAHGVCLLHWRGHNGGLNHEKRTTAMIEILGLGIVLWPARSAMRLLPKESCLWTGRHIGPWPRRLSSIGGSGRSATAPRPRHDDGGDDEGSHLRHLVHADSHPGRGKLFPPVRHGLGRRC